MTLDLGDQVPDLKLPSSSGKEVSLLDYRGKRIILYFYPKDDTPGCTKEACAFRDMQGHFTAKNTVIIGVSKDSLNSHDKFIQKFDLPFELLSDEEGQLMDLFGVWKEKSMYGKTFMGVVRSTFLIDENGKLAKAWRNVRVKDHAEKVLEAINALG